MDFPAQLRDRYQPERVLGSGSFGEVVLAEDRELGRKVAVKLLRVEAGRSSLSRERFDREARLTAQLSSAHVAKVIEADASADTAYIVYEFVEGRPLNERIEEEGPLELEEAGRLFREILDGLAALHAEGVLHRDVKPANVILESTGSAVLIDLGLGRTEQCDTLTATGAILGSPAYMAPEQMAGGLPDPTWDLYAAALTYWRMVTGQAAMLGRNLPETYNRKCEGLPRGLREEGYPVSRVLDRVLRRALSPDPAKRYSSAVELRAAVEKAFPGASRLRPAMPAPPPKPPEDPAPSRPGRAQGLVVLGLLLAGSAWLMLPGGTLPEEGRPLAPPTPEARTSAAAAHLEELFQIVEDDPAIRTATSLGAELTRKEALARWQRGREAFLRHLEDAGLAELLRKLAFEPSTPAIQRVAARLHLIERLLSITTVKAIEPLPASGLADFLARSVRIREEPAMSGPVGEEENSRAGEYRRLLSEGGRHWLAVRSFDDLRVPGDPRMGFLSDIRLQNLAGDSFPDPIPGGTDVLADSLYGARALRQSRAALPEATHRLHPFQGDLFLAFNLAGWVPTAQLVLEIRGREEDVPVVFCPPPLVGPTRVGCCSVRQGFMLQVREAVLPEGRNRIRLTIRGLQPLSTARSSLIVDEVLQLVGGPPPDMQ